LKTPLKDEDFASQVDWIEFKDVNENEAQGGELGRYHAFFPLSRAFCCRLYIGGGSAGAARASAVRA
jgi:hypothetical protein